MGKKTIVVTEKKKQDDKKIIKNKSKKIQVPSKKFVKNFDNFSNCYLSSSGKTNFSTSMLEILEKVVSDVIKDCVENVEDDKKHKNCNRINTDILDKSMSNFIK